MNVPKKGTTLRAKIGLTLLGAMLAVGLSTLAVVVLMSVRSAQANLADVQERIVTEIVSKGRFLTANHALALHNMVDDNAFGNIQGLIARTVAEEDDVLYGLYVDTESRAWAYTAPNVVADHDSLNSPPKPDAWKALGLDAKTLMVTSLQKRSATVFGQEVLEFAFPVMDGVEQLGTLRYGLSTQRMRSALSAVQARSDGELRRTVLLLVGLVVGITFLGLLVSRGLTARITKPLGQLTEAAQALAAGQRMIRVEIRSRDELETLGSSFNEMAVELNDSYSALEGMNRTLEERVVERTAALATRNRGMRLVLDNVQEGLVTLSTSGVMALERSAVVDQWFGPCDRELPLWEYLRDLTPTFADELELGWESIVEDVLPLELAMDQLPRRVTARNRVFDVAYSPLLQNGELDGVLVVIKDVTERLLREREEAEQQEFIAAVRRIIRDRSGFMSFFDETARQLRALSKESDILIQKRLIHTIKGNAGLFGLDVVAQLCHRLEERLAETGRAPDALDLDALQTRWQTLSVAVLALAGEDSTGTIEVSRQDYDQLVQTLSAESATGEALARVSRWRLEPVSRPFARLGEQAVALAARLGKGQLIVEQKPHGVRLDATKWAPFWSDMAHVVRNAVDHGFEDPEQRARSGKGRPLLTLSAVATAEDTLIELADDGCGVDWEQVRAKALRLGLPAASQSDLVEALFEDGLSTCEVADAISGRGVGMAAVRARVRQMGGSIELRSIAGKGSSWRLRIPRTFNDSSPPPETGTPS